MKRQQSNTQARAALAADLRTAAPADDWRATSVLMRHVFGEHGYAAPGALIFREFEDHDLFFDPRDDKIGTTLLAGRPWQRHFITRALSLLAASGYVFAGKHLIDVGANIGTSLIYLMRGAPFYRAHAFEPDPHNADILQRNVTANRLKQAVRVVRSGVGCINEQALLARHPKNFGCHRIVGQSDVATGDARAIPMTTLNSYVIERRLAPSDIGFVKIDVEGHELDVLEGMSELRAARVPLLLEVNGLDGDAKRLSQFRDLISGYTVVVDVSAEQSAGIRPSVFAPTGSQQELLIY